MPNFRADCGARKLLQISLLAIVDGIAAEQRFLPLSQWVISRATNA
jgi:hypothetical protein